MFEAITPALPQQRREPALGHVVLTKKTKSALDLSEIEARLRAISNSSAPSSKVSAAAAASPENRLRALTDQRASSEPLNDQFDRVLIAMLYHAVTLWLIFDMALWLYLVRPAGTSFEVTDAAFRM
jgi:hypothetical protein